MRRSSRDLSRNGIDNLTSIPFLHHKTASMERAPAERAPRVRMTVAISSAASDTMRLVRHGGDAVGDQAAALFALANGLVGVEGVADECAAAPCAYLPGAYVSRPIDYHESFPRYATATDTRIKCPSPVALRLRIDGEPVEFAAAERAETESLLDLASGQLRRRTRWRLVDGRTIEIAAVRIVPLDGDACVATRLSVSPVDFAATIEIDLVFGTDSDGGNADAADDPRISGRLQPVWTVQPSEPGDTPSVVRFAQGAVELAYRQRVASIDAPVVRVDGGHMVRGGLVAGGTLSVDRVVAMTCTRGRPVDIAALPEPQPFDAIAAAQQRAVDQLWAHADFAIAGDDALTQALRFDLFQLHQSASRDPEHSIAAKGLSGEGYEGHYFWDAESFMLPVLALQMPDRARTLLQYRIGKLAAARAHARGIGHARGALYPWRTIGGAASSPHHPTGSAPYHIQRDHPHGGAFYAAAPADNAFRRAAAEMLFETARIWPEIGAFDPRRGGAFCIYGVTGPDEYSALVDNDYYTNAIAARHLAYAADTADWLAHTDPEAFAALAQAIGLDGAEVAMWRRAAEAMWLPVDAEAGVSPQDDAFLGRPKLADLAPLDERGPLLMRYHPMILFRHQIAKQGNVLQAMAMDLVSLPLALQRRNFDYYSRVTAHDSTLSSVAFAIVAARLGEDAEALDFHREAAFVDLENRHGNTSHGLHMAALAGGWLGLAHGWGGPRPRRGSPPLPPPPPRRGGRPPFPPVWARRRDRGCGRCRRRDLSPPVGRAGRDCRSWPPGPPCRRGGSDGAPGGAGRDLRPRRRADRHGRGSLSCVAGTRRPIWLCLRPRRQRPAEGRRSRGIAAPYPGRRGRVGRRRALRGDACREECALPRAADRLFARQSVRRRARAFRGAARGGHQDRPRLGEPQCRRRRSIARHRRPVRFHRRRGRDRGEQARARHIPGLCRRHGPPPGTLHRYRRCAGRNFGHPCGGHGGDWHRV